MVNTPPKIRQNSGFALAELMLAMMIGITFLSMLAMYIDSARKESEAREHAAWIAQYLNGVASFMASRGVTPPAANTVTGTDFFKPSSCGGVQPTDDFFVSCDMPTNFNRDYGLDAPKVVFDWSTPTAPTAAVSFGVVGTVSNPNPKVAALLASGISEKLEVDDYMHVTAYTVDPSIDPAADPAGFRNSIEDAELNASIDGSILSTIYVRRDGNSIIKGPLVTEHDNWAMIARDENGDENADPQSSAASTNVNDMYVRSNDAWASETHDLAEEAYRLAARTPQFISEVKSGTTIPKPSCPGSLTPQIFTYPVIFTGGPALNDTRFLSGIRTPAKSVGSSWKVYLKALYEEGTSWEDVPDNMGRISVTTRCS